MRTVCLTALMVLVAFARVSAGDEPASPRPTLLVLQDLMRATADSLFSSLPASTPKTVCTSLLPEGTYWYLEQPAFDALRQRQLIPSQSRDADYLAELGVTQSGVLFQNARRTWFLGSQQVDRRVHLTVRAKVLERTSGVVLAARETTLSSTDTVYVSDVDALETPGIPATRGALPSPGVFSSLVEPVILVGSIAVAIVLLFSVRS